jgi:glutaredoxin
MSRIRVVALAALALWAGVAGAQVYRIVGPDGRVTFSDRPPPDAKATPAQSLAIPPVSGATPGAVVLPAEVRAAAGRFPVTLYTGADCNACASVRDFLASRGVPYTERTVSTDEDVRALGRLMGAAPRVPFATIGGQHVLGFSDAEWTQYLDAAGYPKTSQLPPGYRNPAPAPLVAVQAPPKRTAATPAARREPQTAEPPVAGEPEPSNPAGIRF